MTDNEIDYFYLTVSSLSSFLPLILGAVMFCAVMCRWRAWISWRAC